MADRTTDLSVDRYEIYIHTMGRMTLAAGFLASVIPPVLLWLVYGIAPPGKNLLSGFISITSVMLPVSIVEVLTFSPILGAGAMYMSYLTGNISNLKIPSAAVAIETTGVKPSTREGDIIANLAIAGSVLAGEVIIVAGVILIIPISVQLKNPVIQPAFEQILPALFGALGAYYLLRDWKLAAAPLAAALLLGFAVPGLPSAVAIPVCIAFSLVAARFLYKKDIIKNDEKIET